MTDNLDNLRTACRSGEKLDSLGNVVALLPGDDLRNLVQENAYDPWGLNLPDLERSAVLPDWWQFSMKERDYRAYDEFEFRHYDAAIGRFMSIDPLFQQFRGISPFNYADNNPSTFIDLYGLQGRVTTHDPGNSGAISSGGGSASPQGPSFGFGGIGNVVGTLVFNYYVNKKINEPRDKALEALNASPNVRLAQQKASLGLYGRAAAAGWQPGQPMPGIDAIQTDYTLAGAYVGTKVLAKPLEYLARPIAGALKTQWIKYMGNGKAVETIPNGNFYSVAFETKIPNSLYPNKGSYSHFKAANTALSEAMATDATFANNMKSLGISIPRTNGGTITGGKIPNWVWHHNTEPGVMQLVPQIQHTNGSIFWNTLHPGGRGGMSIWGGGYRK
ncbi:RHS repeat-associated core domain-containing protein [Salmonirosea aquatica]|uniref:RHS repeat-associated core domain-containing protein n=1 Tax=Salmonirosea aquatica TaxID=2654236 RepID=A0A7C9F201_9BACT|nr:hypothetical protein [Cytophagaceae bacterium SJW1-29]